MSQPHRRPPSHRRVIRAVPAPPAGAVPAFRRRQAGLAALYAADLALSVLAGAEWPARYALALLAALTVTAAGLLAICAAGRRRRRGTGGPGPEGAGQQDCPAPAPGRDRIEELGARAEVCEERLGEVLAVMRAACRDAGIPVAEPARLHLVRGGQAG